MSQPSSSEPETQVEGEPLAAEPTQQPLGAQPAPRRFRKPQADLYTVLLIAALVALIIGCICLYLELGTFDHQTTGGLVPSGAAIFRGVRTLGVG